MGVSGGVAVVSEPDEVGVLWRQLGVLCGQGHEESFDAGSEPDARGGLAAEVFDEVVISSTPSDGILSADSFGDELPDGVGVIVETSDELAINEEGHTGLSEEFFDAFKVVLALLGEGFEGGWSVLADLDIAGVFAVEDAEGVGFKAADGVFAQARGLGFEEIGEDRAIFRLAFAIAEAVDAQGEAFESALAVEVHLEADALDVLFRLRDAEGFDAELVVLPEAAGLWFFVAEIGTDVVDLLS